MTIFFRLLESDDKGTALHQAIAQLTIGNPNSDTFLVEPTSFQQVPGSPFAYWVSEEIRNVFQRVGRLENEQRITKQGLATADDFRFIRVFWEVPQQNLNQNLYLDFAKGGSFSRFYSDIFLSVNWLDSGSQIWSSLNEKGQTRSNIWMLKDTIRLFF